MKNRSLSFLALVAFVVAMGVRLVDTFSSGGSTVLRVALFYIAAVLGILMLLFSSLSGRDYAPAVSGCEDTVMKVASYICAAGFFVDFVYGTVTIYDSVQSGTHTKPVYFLPVCIGCGLALICSFYFVMSAVSFVSSGYDIRSLRIAHIAPIAWSVVKVLSILPQAVRPDVDINFVIRITMLLFLTGGSYAFALELLSSGGTRRISLFLFRGAFYTGWMFLLDQSLMIIADNADVICSDSMLAVTALGISIFMYCLEKGIISRSNIT